MLEQIRPHVLEPPASIVLRHVDRLSPSGQRALTDLPGDLPGELPGVAPAAP